MENADTGGLRALSFRTRLTLRWTAAFGVLMTAALVAVYLGASAHGYRLLDLHLRTVAATELASSTDQGSPIHLHEFPIDVLNAREFAPKFSRVYDSSGGEVLRQGETPFTGPLLDAGAMAAALAGEAPVVDLVAQGRRARLVALRTTGNRGETYVIAVGMFTEALDRALAGLRWILAAVWLAAIGATAAVGYLLASRALVPIDRITERAAAIARDRLDARLDPPAADDEIGRMTARLNEMLDRLHRVIDAHRHFAADASHELRSPLTAIKGEIDVALTRPRNADEYRDTLTLVRAQVDEMFLLTEDLMLLVRADRSRQADVFDQVPLASLVEGCRQRLSQSAERGVSVHGACGQDLTAFGDARLLGRALDNVVANAVQHSPAGAVVRIDARFSSAGVDVWDAGTIIVEVTDNGPGIPAEHWDRIFDRFFRLDASRSRRTGGSGLGLAICRAILELFGGSVKVVRSTSAGTTFELTLRGCRVPVRSVAALEPAAAASHQ
jgi:two-component system OmpR family sensor kinase